MKKKVDSNWLDRVFLYGAPIVFIALLLLGVRLILGPSTRENPIKALHSGIIEVGDSEMWVEKQLGEPRQRWFEGTGSEVLRYDQSTWNNSNHTVTIEDCYITLAANGRVTEIKFETHEPKPAAD